jgi:putative ABC transport system permease protein
MKERRLYREAEQEVRAILSERLQVSPADEEAIPVWTPVEFLSRLPLDQVQGLLFVLAAATLLIGGVGTLNMMLDSVYERRHEIGVRLAVGARRRDILTQFFLETFTVTSLGGLLGVALGVACQILGGLRMPDLIPVPVLSARVVVLAVGVMTGVGLLAGLVPAWRAAAVDPASTLRMD